MSDGQPGHAGLHRTGLSIVRVTHEPDIAQYAQRILSFRDGMPRSR